MRILHAIHDFLPLHQAGSELYAFHLCRELARRHEVRVLCAEYDVTRPHASLHARAHEGIAVTELVNNWRFGSFEETYRSPEIGRQLAGVLDEARPDVLHIHSLLNLSFDLPALARKRGIPSVATLHDFTLVCPSNGQRVHLAEEHVCREIDPDRCARCFPDSPFYRQMAAFPPRPPGLLARLGIGRNAPALPTVTASDIRRRLDDVRRVADAVDLFVAPSTALAADMGRFGIPPAKIRVSDYGFVPLRAAPARLPSERLRIGYVGTLYWHKGVHVLLEAARSLPPERFELLLYGNTEWFPDYVASLRRLAEGMPVRFEGSFENTRAAEIYSGLDVLVVPSLWPENSPLVIHEAFQAGLPVVGARSGGIPELVRHGENGLVYDPFSAGELAAALRSLVEDRDSLARFARALPAVKSIEVDAREWEAIYGHLVKKTGPPS